MVGKENGVGGDCYWLKGLRDRLSKFNVILIWIN